MNGCGIPRTSCRLPERPENLVQNGWPDLIRNPANSECPTGGGPVIALIRAPEVCQAFLPNSGYPFMLSGAFGRNKLPQPSRDQSRKNI